MHLHIYIYIYIFIYIRKKYSEDVFIYIMIFRRLMFRFLLNAVQNGVRMLCYNALSENYLQMKKWKRGYPRGVMVKATDCGIVVSEFILQSRYYVHFRANTLGKGMNPLILPAMGEIVPLLFFLKNGFCIK